MARDDFESKVLDSLNGPEGIHVKLATLSTEFKAHVQHDDQRFAARDQVDARDEKRSERSWAFWSKVVAGVVTVASLALGGGYGAAQLQSAQAQAPAVAQP